MTSDFMEHKGYQGTVQYSATDNLLFGQIIGIKSLISYEGSSISQLRADFESAVDDYLLDCSESGVEPQQPRSGSLGA